MATTSYRMFLWHRIGRCHENFRAPEITPNSMVYISVSEATANEVRFVGAANITVHNISPSSGRVDFVVTVDWHAPIHIMTDILIFDRPGGPVIVGK